MAKSRLNKSVGVIDKIFIEDPRRAIVIGVAVVLLIVLVVLFWSRIKAAFRSIVNRSAATSELQQHEQETGEYPTLSNSTYITMANTVYQACKGWGTDEEAIYRVFNQLNNTADVYKLIQVFGTKDNKTLDQWLYSDLGSREIRKVNTILTNKGIAYNF